VTPNFWGLNAYSSQTAKATDFKFDSYVPNDSSDMTPWNNFGKGGVVTPRRRQTVARI